MGREHFIKENELLLDKLYTVDDFVKLTENTFGKEVIKQLKKKWEEKNK